MARLRRRKQDGSGEARQQRPPAPQPQPARYQPAQAGSRFEPGLERRWEEAWRRARAADFK